MTNVKLPSVPVVVIEPFFSSCTTAPAIGVIPLVSVTIPEMSAIRRETPNRHVSDAFVKTIELYPFVYLWARTVELLTFTPPNPCTYSNLNIPTYPDKTKKIKTHQKRSGIIENGN
jgi:hypothetical protein